MGVISCGIKLLVLSVDHTYADACARRIISLGDGLAINLSICKWFTIRRSHWDNRAFPDAHPCLVLNEQDFLNRLMNGGIGVVLRSEIAGVEIGTYVRRVRGALRASTDVIEKSSSSGIHDYPSLGMMEVIEKGPKFNWSLLLGAAVMTGTVSV
jgi:hypothetical protein